MPVTRDPNDFNKLVDMDLTVEVNSLDRQYELFSDTMFKMKPTTTNTVMMDFNKRTGKLLPSVDRGARASTYGSDQEADTRIFGTAYFKHSDAITPEDLENVRAIGTPDGVTTLEQATADKMRDMRVAAEETEAYMKTRAIYEGRCVAPDGKEIMSIFTELGVSQEVFDLKLDVATTDVLAKIRELKRKVRLGLQNGGMYKGMMIDVDPVMFDKLISHPEVKEAYKYFANNQNQPNQYQPLRDTSDTFTHGGITFRSVEGSFNLPDGTSEDVIAANTGHVIPVSDDLWRGYYGTSNKLSRVNGRGGVSPYYLHQYADPKDESYELQLEMTRLYLPVKAAPLIKLTSTGA